MLARKRSRLRRTTQFATTRLYPCSGPTAPPPTTTSAQPSGTSTSLDKAIAEYRKTLQLHPDLAPNHYYLGLALYGKGQADEAITEFRKALQIRPGFADAHTVLGYALDLAKHDAVLPIILRGKAAPTDAAQQVRFADFCQRYKRLNAAASRFYADAFAAEPGLAKDLRSGTRYNAACTAALAGCGQGEDAAKTNAKDAQPLAQPSAGLAAGRSGAADQSGERRQPARPGRDGPGVPALEGGRRLRRRVRRRRPCQAASAGAGRLAQALGRRGRPAEEGPGEVTPPE